MGKAEGGSKADTAVKLVLIFFISLLSFSVGTYVGKQVSDSDYHRANLEVDYGHSSSASADAHADGEAAGEKGEGANAGKAEEASGETTAEATSKPITEEEVSNLAEEFIKTEARKPSSEDKNEAAAEGAHADAAAEKAETGYTHHSKAKAEVAEKMTEKVMADHKAAVKEAAHAEKHEVEGKKVAAAEKMTGAEKAVTKAADRVAHDMAPVADTKKVAAKPTTALPNVATSAVGKYTVQVASFATEAEAKQRSAELTEKGYNAFFVPATINGKTWFRVSVGLFSDQKSAANYRTELLATQIVSTAIVQKIVK